MNVSTKVPQAMIEPILFASTAEVESAFVSAGISYISTIGYHSPGDGGAATFVRAASEPAHGGKVQSADGSWWELAETKPNLLQFGGIDDGTTTDDTAAFEAMSSYCQAKQRPGRVPATILGFATNGGPHRFDYGLHGDGGIWNTTIYVTHPTNDVISQITPTPGSISDLHFFASVTRTAGNTLIIDAPAGQAALHPIIQRNVFQNGYVDIALLKANIASVLDNFSVDFRQHFIYINNSTFPDNGDQYVAGNTWDTSQSAPAGIMQLNAGGLKMVGNKGGRAGYAYRLLLQGTVPDSTSILIINGNSFENQTLGQISLERQPGGTATFDKVIISNNEFAGATANAAISLDNGQDFIQRLIITNNVIQFFGPAGISATVAKNMMIGGNSFNSSGGGVGITCGVSSSGYIAKNIFQNVGTPIANASGSVVVAA